jgi:hypothetical protein
MRSIKLPILLAVMFALAVGAHPSPHAFAAAPAPATLWLICARGTRDY